MEATFKDEKPSNPRSKANIFEIISYSWTLKLIKKGLKCDLELIDLYTILDGDSSALLGSKLQKLWNDELINAKNKNQKPSFLKTLFQMFGVKFMIYGIVLTIVDIILSITKVTLVGRIVLQFGTTTPVDKSPVGVYLVFCFVINLILRSILFSSYDMMMSHLGMQIRVATCDLIYNKALRLKTNSFDQTSTGHIVNLMSNDVNRFDVSLVYLPFIWIGPLVTIIATYFMWQEVGVSSVLGVSTLVICVPFQVWLGFKTLEIRLKIASKTDERVNLMKEIISCLQIIKMYTWEPFFVNIIKNARKNEIKKIIQSSYVKGILSSFILFNSRIALFVNLFAYIQLGNYIIASKVFVITSYYSILNMYMSIAFPPGIGLAAELFASIQRIEVYLLQDEKNRKLPNFIKSTNKNEVSNIEINDNNTVQKNVINQNNTELLGNFDIAISNSTAKWTATQTDNSLEKINLTVKRGQLVAIIGPVGAGKSSLIQAILQELPLSEGRISVRGVISYASQEPWIFAGSVQQNILFGSPMDKKRYEEVIEVCALQTDMKQLQYGDKTIVGERGLSLSGGQKARINLARAIYKQADVYLLDDPLSAVDTPVGKHLFEKCIKDYLREKTRVLITHQLQYLIKVDQIVLLENAKVKVEGSYQDLKNSGLNFMQLQEISTDKVVDNFKVKGSCSSSSLVKYSMQRIRQESVSSVASSIEESKRNEIKSEPIETAETRSRGNISLNVYSSYIFSGGHYCKIFGLLFVCIITQILASGEDYWITFWVNLEEHVFRSIEHSSTPLSNNAFDGLMKWAESRQTCVIVFAVLTFSILITALCVSAFLVSICTTASTNLHNHMFNSITKVTMNFLSNNPSGRILNRFSKDIGLIDEILPTILANIIQSSLTLLGIFIVVGIMNPYFIPPTLIVLIMFYKIRTVYMKTTRNVKRLEGISRSPLYTHVNASLQGLTTIRAFGLESILAQEFANHQDLHSSAWYLFIVLTRAFGFWLDLICILYIGFIIFYLMLIGNDTNRGTVGLVITQFIPLTGLIQWSIRQSAELENQMTSVERVLEYTNLPQESNLQSTPDKRPPKEWPNKGQIIFKQYYLRYDWNALFVLKNLNIKIDSTEKIGIVGRTGAGKSSLIGALFRLALNEGNIIIDNIEIHDLGLHDLRSKLTIIPQEPVLFSGTIRKNLDPYDEYPDHILWNALDQVQLKVLIEDTYDGLNSKIFEGVANFSAGQRQLICLARAIIKNNRILVLDEATANVDPQTDDLIQNTIRNTFRLCTVLTIAHRLNTVIDSDKILVMDTGTVVEFDRPHSLLQNKNGYLYKMVKQTGKINANLLHRIAEENYYKNKEK